MTATRCVLIAALLLCTTVAGAREPKVGVVAPPLAFGALFNAPEGQNTSWNTLKGKLVVLDFWATWCGPCIVSFPRTRELAESLKDEDIAFVFISVDEKAEDVEEFLRESPLPGWVGIDSMQSVSTAYGIQGYPTAALVSPAGKFLGYFDLGSVTADQLRAQAGSETPLDFVRASTSSRVELSGDPWADPRTQVSIIVRHSEEDAGMMSAYGGGLQARGVHPLKLYEFISNLAPNRFRGEVPEVGQALDVVTRFRTEAGYSDVYDATRAAVDAALGVRSIRQKSLETVTVLRLPAEKPALWNEDVVNPSSINARWEDGALHLGNHFPFFLAQRLSLLLDEPVEFEGPDDLKSMRFDAVLPIREDFSAEDLVAAYREHFGIETVRKEREIDVLMFEKNGD